jgi:hypothetical protein
MTSIGSTKTVWPEPERSWTIPGTRARGRDDRQAVAVIAEDDDGVADEIAPFLEDLSQAPGDLAAALAQRGAHLGKLRRRVVADRAVGIEEPPGAAEELDEPRHRVAAPSQVRRLGFRQRPADRLRGPRGGQDRAEVFGSGGAARGREGLEDRGDLLDAGQREAPVPCPESPQLGGFGQAPGDRLFVVGGSELEDRALAGRGAREGGNQPEDEGELERVPLASGNLVF